MFELRGSSGLETLEQVMPITGGTAEIWLFAFVLSHGGALEVESISAMGMAEYPVLRAMWYLVVAWR